MRTLGQIIDIGLGTMKPVLSPETLHVNGRVKLNTSQDTNARRKTLWSRKKNLEKYLPIQTR